MLDCFCYIYLGSYRQFPEGIFVSEKIIVFFFSNVYTVCTYIHKIIHVSCEWEVNLYFHRINVACEGKNNNKRMNVSYGVIFLYSITDSVRKILYEFSTHLVYEIDIKIAAERVFVHYG